MEENINNEIVRRLVRLEEHIINLIVPVQQINLVLRSPGELRDLLSAFNKPIAIDDVALRRCVNSLQNSIEDFYKKTEKLHTTKTHDEIKFIAKKLHELEQSIAEIKENGIKKEVKLEISCDGYELVKKPMGYDPKDPVEEPQDDLKKLLDTLTTREAKVLIQRFGLFDQKKKTYKAIGEIYHISAERTSQICIKALRKCRHPSRHRLIGKQTPDALRKAILGE